MLSYIEKSTLAMQRKSLARELPSLYNINDMQFKITNGSVSYGANTVLTNINFEIRDREKIAVVGRNGCGKTTLLRAVTGEAALEEGTGEEGFSVTRTSGLTVGYLKQNSFADDNATMAEEILKVFKPITDLEAKTERLLALMQNDHSEDLVREYAKAQERYEFLGGYTYMKEYATAVKKLGFTEEDKAKRLNEFSGGQRTKIAFIKLLLSKPNILLLDEPTNHLDITAVEWLEGYLKTYPSAVVIVSHDRMFLNKIVGKVYEIEYGETKCYPGNYSDFERRKRENYIKQRKDYDLQQAEIKRLTALVERFRYKASKAAMAQSKLKQIERIRTAEEPDRYDLRTFRASFEPEVQSSQNTLFVKDMVIGYSPTEPLAKVNFELERGTKLGIIGANGIGKSTLLKTLIGKVPALSGYYMFGANVKIGYFDQQSAEMHGSKTVYDSFYDEFPFMNTTEVRSSLGAFLFTGEDVFKTVDNLSGGEKVRLALCKIFKRRPNVLILDEPTNHMDIVGKETLENMLSAYTGTVIVVSHDRYFINKIADELLVFDGKQVTLYPMRYEQYEERVLNALPAAEAPEQKTEKKQNSKKGFLTPLKELSIKTKRINKLESLIEQTEGEIAKRKELLDSPEVYSDYVKITALQSEIEELDALLTDYTEEWSELEESLSAAPPRP